MLALAADLTRLVLCAVDGRADLVLLGARGRRREEREDGGGEGRAQRGEEGARAAGAEEGRRGAADERGWCGSGCGWCGCGGWCPGEERRGLRAEGGGEGEGRARRGREGAGEARHGWAALRCFGVGRGESCWCEVAARAKGVAWQLAVASSRASGRAMSSLSSSRFMGLSDEWNTLTDTIGASSFSVSPAH